ncbi:unnamed protein product, partial [Thlaspi arvense]
MWDLFWDWDQRRILPVTAAVMETASPNLNECTQFAEGIKSKTPEVMLTYNLSPSFKWDAFGMTDQQMYITLAGFHAVALVVDTFAEDYARRGMLAYVERIQREERSNGIDTLAHQKWSGANYYDHYLKTVQEEQGRELAANVTDQDFTSSKARSQRLWSVAGPLHRSLTLSGWKRQAPISMSTHNSQKESSPRHQRSCSPTTSRRPSSGTLPYITLAGFHAIALVGDTFADDYARRGMLAYVERIQREERSNGVDIFAHQKWSGANYYDRYLKTVQEEQGRELAANVTDQDFTSSKARSQRLWSVAGPLHRSLTLSGWKEQPPISMSAHNSQKESSPRRQRSCSPTTSRRPSSGMLPYITLAGFHVIALVVDTFAEDYARRGMLAYVERIQREERSNGVGTFAHQKWSGANYYDRYLKTVQARYEIGLSEEQLRELAANMTDQDFTSSKARSQRLWSVAGPLHRSLTLSGWKEQAPISMSAHNLQKESSPRRQRSCSPTTSRRPSCGTLPYITLAGFHVIALVVDTFAEDYAGRGMLAYVERIQREERSNGVETFAHQKWSGANYYDRYLKTVQGFYQFQRLWSVAGPLHRSLTLSGWKEQPPISMSAHNSQKESSPRHQRSCSPTTSRCPSSGTLPYIMLAGFHVIALVVDTFAEDYARRGMLAYVERIQREERSNGVETFAHQKWSGANYYDRYLKTVQ